MNVQLLFGNGSLKCLSPEFSFLKFQIQMQMQIDDEVMMYDSIMLLEWTGLDWRNFLETDAMRSSVFAGAGSETHRLIGG